MKGDQRKRCTSITRGLQNSEYYGYASFVLASFHRYGVFSEHEAYKIMIIMDMRLLKTHTQTHTNTHTDAQRRMSRTQGLQNREECYPTKKEEFHPKKERNFTAREFLRLPDDPSTPHGLVPGDPSTPLDLLPSNPSTPFNCLPSDSSIRLNLCGARAYKFTCVS